MTTERRNNLLTRVSKIAGLVGLIGSGIWAAEVHYARAADLTQHVQAHQAEAAEFRLEILESRRYNLRRDIFEMEQTAKRRALTAEEARYLDQLREEYVVVVVKIQAVRKPKP